MKLFGLTFGAALLAATAASAGVLTFDDQDSSPSQTVPLPSYETLEVGGYTFGVSTQLNNNGDLGAAIFNTNCINDISVACNGDEDIALTTERQGENGIEGNVLIIQEKSPSAIPDDTGSGGTITLTLLEGTPFQILSAAAIDDGTFTFGTSVDGEIDAITLGENETGRVYLNSSVVGIGDTVTIKYSGSGGVDSFVIAPVPVPAASLLLIGAMGGLAALRRRA